MNPDTTRPPTPFEAALLTSRGTPIYNVLQFFRYGHLPDHLQEPFADLAAVIAVGPLNPETTVALRKLLEAKDAAVRAHLYTDGS